jgi:hypothetical protein
LVRGKNLFGQDKLPGLSLAKQVLLSFMDDNHAAIGTKQRFAVNLAWLCGCLWAGWGEWFFHTLHSVYK